MQQTPSASYTSTLRVKLTNRPGTLGELTTAIGRAGGDIGAIDIVSASRGSTVRDITFTAASSDHVNEIVEAVRPVEVVTDGTAVLGLGDIGPAAAMPVMEGKAMLFKEFAGVDAFPVCLSTKDPDEIVRTVKTISTAFGGINLEDISAPRCFEIEERLKEELDIPVFHDDQHGTAVVVLAALINAVKIVGKRMEDLKVVVNGTGAAGVACTKIVMSAGVQNVVGCDQTGALYRGRTDNMNWVKDWYAQNTNPDNERGGIHDVIRGADVFFGHAAVMATGRSDYPNQINNVLCFPGIFRGALQCRASRINEEMKLAAARAIAST